MKKLILFFILLSTLTINAQKNQVKLDLFDVLVMRSLDVSYEKQLNDEASVGTSIFINFSPKNAKLRYNENFQITPYFRQRIKSINNFNFFAEIFASLNFGETDEKKNKEGLITQKSENYSDLAAGVGGGGSYVSRNGYIFEFNVGIGRNLFNEKAPNIIPRLGISVGKQF